MIKNNLHSVLILTLFISLFPITSFAQELKPDLIISSVPLLSVIAMIWLYSETRSIEKVSQLSTNIFWLVIPSLSLFILLPFLLKLKVDFYPALLVSIIVMILLYYAMIFILAKFGVKI